MKTGRWRRMTAILLILFLAAAGFVQAKGTTSVYADETDAQSAEAAADSTSTAQSEAGDEIQEYTESVDFAEAENDSSDVGTVIETTEEAAEDTGAGQSDDSSQTEVNAQTEYEEADAPMQTEPQEVTVEPDESDESDAQDEQPQDITFEMQDIEMMVDAADAGMMMAAASGTAVSASYIASALGTASQFGVFAMHFGNYSHMEATVAAYELYGCENQFGLTQRVTSSASSYQITVNKTATGAGKQGTFTVGVFGRNADGSYTRVGNLQTITTNAQGTGSTTFSGSFQNYSELYVFEVDPSHNNQIVSDNGTLTAGGTDYTVTYGTQMAVVRKAGGTAGNNSYIQTFTGSNSGSQDMLNENALTTSNLYVGSGYTVTTDASGVQRITGSGANYFVGAKGHAEVYNGTFPINFSSEFTNLTNLSKTLAVAASTSDVRVVNITASGADNFWLDASKAMGVNDQNYITNYGFGTVGDNQYLIVNVDCTNVKETGYSIKRYMVNGKSTSNYGCTDYQRIIFNFYTKSGNTCTPYTGNIMLDDTGGTFLVPGGSVTEMKNVLGTVIANTVNHPTDDGELHGDVYSNGSVTTVYGTANITNTSDEVQIPKYYFSKTDESGNSLGGATLKLQRWVQNQYLDIENQEWTTTVGQNHMVSGLADGYYRLVETAAPTGYAVASPIEFTIENGVMKVDGTEVSGATITMVDKRVCRLLIWKSYNADGTTSGDISKLPANLYFTVEGDNGYYKEIQFSEFFDWYGGKEYELNDLEPATYTVTEHNADIPGYKHTTVYHANPQYDTRGVPGQDVTDNTIKVQYFTDTNYCAKMWIDNRYTKVTYTFSKTDTEGTLIGGAVLKIQRQNDQGEFKDVSGEKWTTEAGRNHTAQYLENGTYRLVEESAPNGFALADPVEFTIDNGQMYIDGEKADNNTLVMIDQPSAAEIELEAQKSLTGGELTGEDFSFELTGVSGVKAGKQNVWHDGYYETVTTEGYFEKQSVAGYWQDTYYWDYNWHPDDGRTWQWVWKGENRGHYYGCWQYYVEGHQEDVWHEGTTEQVWHDGYWEETEQEIEIDLPMPNGTTDNSLTVKNDTAGKISFGRIAFTEEGTYTYTITEQAGSYKDDSANIVYDTNIYTATVTVKKVNGILEATVQYTDQDGNALTEINGNATASGKPLFINELIQKSKLKLYKVNGQDGKLTPELYRQVEFTVEYVAPDGTRTTVTGPGNDGHWTPNDSGYIDFGELDTGTYIITEVKAPENYMQLPEPVQINVSAEGEITLEGGETVYTYLVGKDDPRADCLESDKDKFLVVRNYPYIEMPESGRNSRWTCMIAGALLMITGTWMYLRGRRQPVRASGKRTGGDSPR